MQHTEFSQKLIDKGLLDDRNAVVFGVMNSHAGNGTCLVCLNGNTMRVFESNMTQQPISLMHEIPVSEIKITKASGFVLHPVLAFEYAGNSYELTRFSCAKEFIAIVQEENKK